VRKRVAVAAVVVLVLAAAAWAAWKWLSPEEEPGSLRVSGTVEATDARLGFDAAGRIAALPVREGDEVEAGQELGRLASDELLARRAQAAAAVEGADARLRQLRRGSREQEIARAREAAVAAREQLEEARREHARTARLREGGAVSQEALDRATTALEVAGSRLAQEEQRLDLVREGPPREEIEAQAARLDEARAALASLDARLAESVLEAPFPGRVTVKHRTEGETVAPGAPVVTLLDLSDRWVRVYAPEDRLGALRLGQAARITADTFPGKTYAGEVFFIASEAEFTPKSVQTREERVRLVYAVKVRVTGDPEHELKPGMPVDVELDLGEGGDEGELPAEAPGTGE
jgi:HlyD family secretion protein